MPSGQPYPFYLDAGVDSARLAQLNAQPFSNDVGYASIVGTHNTIPFESSPNFIDPFKAFQPMSYQTVGPFQTGGAYSYFPWLYQFDDAVGATDGIVPIWSQKLGITAYSPTFDVNHIQVVQNSAVQQQLIAWLADPNIPLGSAQRAQWTNKPPPSEANAYEPTSITESGSSIGGGLNPHAVVGVSVGATGFKPATLGTDPSSVRVHMPTITGMIPVSAINAGGNIEIDLNAGNQSAPGMGASPLITKVSVPISSLIIDPGQLPDPNASDYVAFGFYSASLVFGRTNEQELTGPAGTSRLFPEGLWYSIPALGLTSAPTPISVPAFTLPAPSVSDNLVVTVNGAVEYSGPGTAATVDLFAHQPGSYDIDLGRFSSVTISLPTDPPGTPGVTFWNGVLVPYTAQMVLSRDSSGNIESTSTNTKQQHPYIYQELVQPQGTPNDLSPAIGL